MQVICMPLLCLRREDSLLVFTVAGIAKTSERGTGRIRIPRFFCCCPTTESNRVHPSSTMSIHIGELIKKELEQQGRTKVWLAKQISRTVAACYHIFQCPTIDTGLLFTISRVLNHDFFKDLSADLGIK